jgi:hypothetical protein
MALLLQLTQKLSHGFTAVWTRWPRKEARKDAAKAWTQLDPSPDLESEIHQALDWQIPMLLEREPKYRPLLASWLRGERWTDEKPTPKTPTASRPTVDSDGRRVIPSNIPEHERWRLR